MLCLSLLSLAISFPAVPSQQFVLDLSRENFPVLSYLEYATRQSFHVPETKHGLPIYSALQSHHADARTHARKQAATHERHVGVSHATPCQQRPAWHAFETRPMCKESVAYRSNSWGRPCVKWFCEALAGSRSYPSPSLREGKKWVSACQMVSCCGTTHHFSMTVSTTKLPGMVVFSPAVGAQDERLVGRLLLWFPERQLDVGAGVARVTHARLLAAGTQRESFW